jgi:hypothetical protein
MKKILVLLLLVLNLFGCASTGHPKGEVFENWINSPKTTKIANIIIISIASSATAYFATAGILNYYKIAYIWPFK